MMRFLGTRGPTDVLFICFIFFDLTHIESRISPNIKILFCWSQILSCCPITSIPCIFLAFEIYNCPQTFPPQYKKCMKNGNTESIKFPRTKYGNRFAGNTGCLGKSSSPPPLLYSFISFVRIQLHVFRYGLSPHQLCCSFKLLKKNCKEDRRF